MGHGAWVELEKLKSFGDTELSCMSVIGNSKPDGAHQLQGVAGLHHAGLELVVKMQAAVLDAVFKMAIGCALAEGLRDFGQRQIVRADDADRHSFKEFM